VAIRMMRKILRILFFLILVSCFSCENPLFEEQGIIVKCSECTTDEPIRAELSILFGNNKNTVAVINIYEGNLEDSILLDTFHAYTSPFKYDVSVNKEYTVTATYNIVSNTYIAVDSALPKVKYDKDQCDNPCYFIYDRILDLRLKNY
jgi:hypothetical protein